MTAALIAKLESASEGSRELDRELMALTYVWERRHIGTRCWDNKASGKRGDDNDDTCCPDAKHLDWVWVDPLTDRWKTTARDGFEFTSSVDAAFAWAGRLLPGWCFWVDTDGNADAWNTKHVDSLKQSFVARQPALAICAAILRASANGGAGRVSSRINRRRLAKYKRRKDTAPNAAQFMTWSLRFHRLCNRLYGAPNLWRTT